MRPDPPVTPDSIALAIRQRDLERAIVTLVTGLQFDGDGNPINDRKKARTEDASPATPGA